MELDSSAGIALAAVAFVLSGISVDHVPGSDGVIGIGGEIHVVKALGGRTIRGVHFGVIVIVVADITYICRSQGCVHAAALKEPFSVGTRYIHGDHTKVS